MHVAGVAGDGWAAMSDLKRPHNRETTEGGKPTLTPVEAIGNYGRKVRDRCEKRSGGEDVFRGLTMGVNGALSWRFEGIVASAAR